MAEIGPYPGYINILILNLLLLSDFLLIKRCISMKDYVLSRIVEIKFLIISFLISDLERKCVYFALVFNYREVIDFCTLLGCQDLFLNNMVDTSATRSQLLLYMELTWQISL